MEIVNSLKEEIKKLASEENINVHKLNEYIRVYGRLRAYEVTTVQQAGVAYDDQQYFPEPMAGIPRMAVATVPPIANELGGIFDMIREATCDLNKPKEKNEIEEYIFWLAFLKDNKKDIKKYPMTDRLEELWDREIDCLKYKLYERIVELMKKQLTENVEKETKELENKLKKERETEVKTEEKEHKKTNAVEMLPGIVT